MSYITGNYKRVLIKISGEMFSKKLSTSKEPCNIISMLAIAEKIQNVINLGIGVSIVVGGGNIVRGSVFSNCNNIIRETADSAGMLATVINGLLLNDVLQSVGIDSVVVSNIYFPFDIHKANISSILKYIDEKKVIIFVGGTGISYFSTDTAAVTNAILSRCDIILKATKTDGIYNQDPKKYPNAKHISQISYTDARNLGIDIMESAAFALAQKNNISILVFSMDEPDCFARAIHKKIKHSLVS